MKKLSIADSEMIALGLQDEIRRSQNARYDHRLHAVLLVAQGMSCPEVGRLLGDATRTIENWVNRFEISGLTGLTEGTRSGRPKKLTSEQYIEIENVLRKTPGEVNMEGNLWDGKTLSAYIEKEYQLNLCVRQCQRMFRQFGFRLRKPRPVIARADEAAQEEYKKNSEK